MVEVGRLQRLVNYGAMDVYNEEKVENKYTILLTNENIGKILKK